MALNKTEQAEKWADLKERYSELRDRGENRGDGTNIETMDVTIYVPKDPDNLPIEKATRDYLFPDIPHTTFTTGGIGMNGQREVIILGDHTLSDEDKLWKEWEGV